MNETLFSSPVLDYSDQELNSSYQLTPEEEEQWQALLYQSRYTVQRVLAPIILIIGAVGNSITIAVMTRRHMQSSTTLYLTALALSDMLYLVFMFSLSLKHNPGMSHKNNWFYWHYFRYALWLTDASSTTSIWLTVTFTIERYIAVCHPIKGKVFCTQSRAKRVIIAVYLIFFLLTVTTPHEWVVIPNPDTNGTHLTLGPSELGSNGTYKKIFYWFSALMFIVLPLALLAAFNTFLILAVKRSRKQRTIMTGQSLSRDTHSTQENKITIMLIAVVLLALLCQLPTAAMLIYTSFHEPPARSAEFYICTILNNYFNFLTALNAAANFIFYCALSDRYRRTFMKTFCRRWSKRNSPPPSWMATTGYTNFEEGSPRASMRGSVRHSRASSYRSSVSSGSKASPSQTALRVIDRHHGNPYLTVPPRGFASCTPEEDAGGILVSPKFSCSSTGHPSSPRTYYLRQTFRNGGAKASFEDTASTTDSEEVLNPSAELFDESLKISLDSAVAVPDKKCPKKSSISRYIPIWRSKYDPKPSSTIIEGRNIVITCQNPSLEDQTAV